MERVFPIVVHQEPEPRFRVTVSAADGTEYVVSVTAPAARSFQPRELAATLKRAGAKARATLARRGVKGATVREVTCLD